MKKLTSQILLAIVCAFLGFLLAHQFKMLNEKNKAFMTEALTQVSINGIDKTLKPKNLKRLYEKNCKRG